jgi:hypothetical protein
MVDTPVVKTNDENFAAAFEQLAELGDKPVTQTVMDKIEEAETAPAKTPEELAAEAAAAAAAKTPEEEIETELEIPPGAKTPEEIAAEAAAAAEAAKKPVEKPGEEDPILTRFQQIAREAVAMVPQQQQPSQQQQPPAPPPELYTPEEKAALAEFQKDYPDIAKASALERRQEYRDLLNFAFAEISKRYDPLLPLVQTIAERTHLKDLETATPDYSDVRDKVIDWAGKQPAYLRDAYNHVINNGTVDEVKDLINRYKTETGTAIAPKAAAAPVSKQETELPSKTKKAVAALAPVSSKRTAATQLVTPEDFDGAFAEAAKQLADT